MIRRRLWSALLIFGISVQVAWAGRKNHGLSACAARLLRDSWGISGTQVPVILEPALPKHMEVGVAIISRVHWGGPVGQSPITLVAHFPLPGGYGGRLINLSRLSVRDPLPERFVIGDGTTRRALVGVDRRPGSPLWARLQRIRKQIEKKLGNNPYPNNVLNLLKNHCDQNLMPVLKDDGSGVAQLPWDKRIPTGKPFEIDLRPYADDHVPVRTGRFLPVVPLEHYLDSVDGYCVQEALVNVLVARLFGQPMRIVNGALAPSSPEKFQLLPGHTWTELEAREVMDSTLNLRAFPVGFGGLETPKPYPSHFYSNNWIGIPALLEQEREQPGQSTPLPWRFEYNRFFIVGFDDEM